MYILERESQSWVMTFFFFEKTTGGRNHNGATRPVHGWDRAISPKQVGLVGDSGLAWHIPWPKNYHKAIRDTTCQRTRKTFQRIRLYREGRPIPLQCKLLNRNVSFDIGHTPIQDLEPIDSESHTTCSPWLAEWHIT